MSYALFIAVNAALFIRPSEAFETLRFIPIYNILITICLFFSIGPLSGLLSGRDLRALPGVPFLLVVWATIVSSDFIRGDSGVALHLAVEYAKVLLYVLLFLANVGNRERLENFLSWLLVFTTISTIVATLHYYEFVQIPNLEMLSRFDRVDAATGEDIFVIQLIATGIYNDPNDLGAALATAVLIALIKLTDRRQGLARALWCLPIAAYLHAILLTQSRGAFLGVLAGLFVVFLTRFGWRRTVPIFLIAVLGLLLVVGGRQARLSSNEDTAQGRMGLWIDGVRLLTRSPLTGIGAGRYQDEFGLVAHNSFIHANVELGVVGGMCFLGLFGLPAVAILRLARQPASSIGPELRRMRPYMLGIISNYMVSMCSISRCYGISTYIVYGVVMSYLLVAVKGGASFHYLKGWKPLVWLLLVDFFILMGTLILLPQILDTGRDL